MPVVGRRGEGAGERLSKTNIEWWTALQQPTLGDGESDGEGKGVGN